VCGQRIVQREEIRVALLDGVAPDRCTHENVVLRVGLAGTVLFRRRGDCELERHFGGDVETEQDWATRRWRATRVWWVAKSSVCDRDELNPRKGRCRRYVAGCGVGLRRVGAPQLCMHRIRYVCTQDNRRALIVSLRRTCN
jgi:hypothetical protein